MADIEKIIETLTFLKTHIFTPANMQRSAELGQTLGEVLADAYAFADDMRQNAATGTRSLELERRIIAADLTDTIRALQDHPIA